MSHNLRDRGGSAQLDGNLENAPISLFVDGLNGDMHLRPTASLAIDQAGLVSEAIDDIDGDQRPIGTAADIGADEYGLSTPSIVSDLRIVSAVVDSGVLVAELGWTAPRGAITITLRYSAQDITGASWVSSELLVDDLPGGAQEYSSLLPYNGDTVYFGLKSQNAAGDWSGLSNIAFWPSKNLYLPVAFR